MRHSSKNVIVGNGERDTGGRITNKIIGNEESNIVKEFNEIIRGKINSYEIPELWDGKTAIRIADIIEEEIS